MKESKKQMLSNIGFNKEINRINEKKCPFCGSTKLSPKDFRDKLSLEEFHISGLCQKCQDKIFDFDE